MEPGACFFWCWPVPVLGQRGEMLLQVAHKMYDILELNASIKVNTDTATSVWICFNCLPFLFQTGKQSRSHGEAVKAWCSIFWDVFDVFICFHVCCLYMVSFFMLIHDMLVIVCTGLNLHMFIYVDICVYFIYVYMYIYIYVCICLYMLYTFLMTPKKINPQNLTHQHLAHNIFCGRWFGI